MDMFGQAPGSHADLLLLGGRVIDPCNGRDGVMDVAVCGGRIAAVGDLAGTMTASSTIDARGTVISPGFIDMHVHVYEWVTNFGVPPDAAGIQSGATTIVDQGSSGAWTFGGFKALLADPARTDVRAFLSINVAGALQGGMEGTTLHNPGMVDGDGLVKLAAEHPRLIRGIKCHGESGSMSHWDTAVLERAAEAGRAARLPLYMHTGELFPVDEANRPDPDTLLTRIIPLLKAGDVMAHVYSCMPDGIMGTGENVPEWLHAAKQAGILFDLGHGVNFSFRIARRMMAAGIFPDTLGSDVHGDFSAYHDLSILNYSLVGGLNKLVALGMPLPMAIAGLTCTPARVLGDSSIGHLGAGARANITVLRSIPGAWSYRDAEGARLDVTERLLPAFVVLEGEVITPDCSLLADVMSPMERPRGVTRQAALSPRLANRVAAE